MEISASFAQQVLMILMGIPLCGFLSLLLVGSRKREYVSRTYLLNGGLSLACGVLLVLTFSHGPQRSRLSAADSFQAVSLLSIPWGSGHQFRFGIDGCVLLLVLGVSVLPLLIASFQPLQMNGQKTSPRARSGSFTVGLALLLLAYQECALIFILSMDMRVQLVMLLAVTLILHLLLAVSLSTGRRRCLNRLLCQLLLSDFLIVAGYLSLTATLIRYTSIVAHPERVFDFAHVMHAVELLREEDFTAYTRLQQALTPSLCLVSLGCVMRLGTFPLTFQASRIWGETTRLHQILFWVHGPVLGLAIILRQFQLFPDVGYRVFQLMGYFWIPGLIWISLRSRINAVKVEPANRMLFLSTMCALAFGGPNPVSLAGAYLLLFAIGMTVSLTQQTPGESYSIKNEFRFVSSFLTVAGMGCVLIGQWQSTGAGDRGIGTVLLTGLAVILMRWRRGSVPSAGDGEARSQTKFLSHDLISRRSPLAQKPQQGERPAWVQSRLSLSPVSSGVVNTMVWLVMIMLLLVLPNIFWQKMRWDLQKIEFPNSSRGFYSSGVKP